MLPLAAALFAAAFDVALLSLAKSATYCDVTRYARDDGARFTLCCACVIDVTRRYTLSEIRVVILTMAALSI